ncbi:MAG: hypothetical protein WED34_09620 [Planctomycetales bacterium]
MRGRNVIEILTGMFVAFLTLYFLEGQIEVRQRTHLLGRRIATFFRKHIFYGGRSIAPLPPTPLDNEESRHPISGATHMIGVACTLGVRADEQGARGLLWYPFEAHDGNCELAAYSMLNSGRVTNNQSGQHYLYFRFAPNFVAQFRNALLYIVVEYFDAPLPDVDCADNALLLEYDSCGEDGIAATFRSAGTISLTGDNSWKSGVFVVDDGGFTNRANGADCRFGVLRVNRHTKTELCVRRVFVFVAE